MMLTGHAKSFNPVQVVTQVYLDSNRDVRRILEIYLGGSIKGKWHEARGKRQGRPFIHEFDGVLVVPLVLM